MVLVPNVSLRNTISNTTQMRSQELQKLHVHPHTMCKVLLPNIGVRPTISNTTKNMPKHLQKLHAYPLNTWVVLVPNIGHRTTISDTTQIRPQHNRKFMYVHWECAWCQWSQYQRIKNYTNTPTTLQKLHVIPMGMCMVLVKNICISTSISNTTQIRPQHLSNLSAVCVTGCICVVLDMLVLIIIFGTSTTHLPSGHT